MYMDIVSALGAANWVAILAGTVVYCAFSGMWHRSLLFGKQWERSIGFERRSNWTESSLVYIVPTIACFIASIATQGLIAVVDPHSVAAAFELGTIVGIGIGFTVTFTNAVNPIMPDAILYGTITGSAHVIGITLMTLVHYALR
jgi:hypothetical protein